MNLQKSRLFVLVVVLAMLVPMVGAPAAMAPGTAVASSYGPTKVTTATSSAINKIHPKLRSELSAMAASDKVDVMVYHDAGVDVGKYMMWHLTRPYVYPDNIQVTVGAMKVSAVSKVASMPSVRMVKPLANTMDKPQPLDSDVGTKFDPQKVQSRLAKIRAARKAGTLPRNWGKPATLKAAGTAGWWDVSNGHKSAAAWAKGFTGDGVKVMVNDSGIDFAHPDLQGTQARITDPSSPYYGWPEMFDSYSMYLWALDQYLGYNFVASGYADYADTSTVVTGTTAVYQPIGASEPHTYTLPTTSKSGYYHIGSHPDKALQKYWYGERVAVLVVDEHEAGVYDTVYVDLDDDYDFTDDKPLRKGDEISWLDNWDSAANAPGQDGYADVSGGMIYFIADGVDPIPASDWMWGLGVAGNGTHDFGEPGNGDLVAFILNDFTEGGGDHGQLCASDVAGQGVIDGGAPSWKPAGDGTPFTGMVQGGGKNVKLSANGNFYISPYVEDGFLFSALGYDGAPGTDDDIQIISNSWGSSAVDNDGWDPESRMITEIQRRLNPDLSVLVSTGNGAPGYGTVTEPNGPLQIGVGASTQYGSGGLFDSITSTEQINWGDVMSWSNRGPGARGDVGVHVTANGAWGSGDLSLNEWGDGWTAWEIWGGTSRSAPVAAGNLALVYDAYRQAHGQWPDAQTARAIFMSGADDQHYDVLDQGAGMVDADRATDIAGGLTGFYVTPDSWSAGDYHGQVFPGFANIMYPGGTSTKEFTIHNTGSADLTVNLSTKRLVRFAQKNFDFTTKDQSLEEGKFTKPDYLIPFTDQIPAGTELMEVKLAGPYDEFDADGDYQFDSVWRVLVYDWKDINGDGKLWNDANGDGIVETGEIESGEYIRFTYGYNYGDSKQARVKMPLERMHDGIFLGLRHRAKSDKVPVSHLKFQVNFYKSAPCQIATINPTSVTVPAGGTATFQATVSTPSTIPLGVYDFKIIADDGTHASVIPVVVNVAAYGTDFTFGGPPRAVGPYDNGQVYGYFDWLWRAESGDWRFFFADIPEDVPAGTSFLVSTKWDNVPTDLDTLVMGPTPDNYTAKYPDFYGPYTLDTVGGSPNANLGGGVWAFNTSTGGPQDIVSAPMSPGLNLVAIHNVVFAGKQIAENFTGQVGTVKANPASYSATVTQDNGGFDISVTSSMALPDLVAEGFGLGAPETFPSQVIYQDDPNDPSTASYTKTLTLQHAAMLDVSTSNSPGNDIDLYVYYDSDGDGVYETLMGSSTSPTPNEEVKITFPPDGNYMIAVHGWSVPASPSTFDLTVNAVEGYDLQVSGIPNGPFAPNTPIAFHVNWSKTLTGGQTASGVVLLGPSGAPGALAIPVAITKDYLTPKTLTVNPTADTTVDEWAPDTNYNNDPHFYVRQQDVKSALFKFDVSSINSAYPVDKATLRIYGTFATNPNPLTISAYGITDDWDPTTVTYNSMPAMASTAVSETGVTTAPGWVEIDVTDLVRQWVSDPSTNHGLALAGTDRTGVEYAFLSMEDVHADTHPQLVVEYREP